MSMSDAWQMHMTQSKVKAWDWVWKFPFSFSISSAIYSGNWQVIADS